MRNKAEQFYPAPELEPEEMSDKELYRAAVKLVRPDLPGHEILALELAAVKDDRGKLIEFYKKIKGKKGELVDTYA